MIDEKKLKEIKKHLDDCKRPLIFFDDDPDGLCSFLLFYRYKREGKGIPVKGAPMLDDRFLRKVEEYKPDKIFVLDIPMVEQDFLDQVKVPVIWVDHHGPYEREKVKYYNPRLENMEDNSSTTINCYGVVDDSKDLWVAMAGAVGDWQAPAFADEFRKKYPDLLDKKTKKPEDMLFNSGIGRLVKLISFILKGKTSDVLKCIKILTRIKSPYEILKGDTAQGKYILKRAREIEKRFDELLAEAKKKKSKDNLLIYTYTDAKMSFTKELSNELLYLFPKKIIIIGRRKSREVKLSLRSAGKVLLPPIVEAALKGLEGYGGGHEHACGACVNEDQFETFIEQLREALKKEKSNKSK